MSETLQTIVAEATGLSPAAIGISPRPPLDNQSNQLYDVWASNRHLIVKEFLKPDELQDAPVREFRALELLASLDIAPQPVLFQPLTPSLGLECSWITWKREATPLPGSWPGVARDGFLQS